MLKLESYDTVKIGKKLELPDISELLLFPFVHEVDIEDLYRNSNSYLKHIIDSIPLNNDRKYISINSCTQLLSPNVTSAPRGNWHFDSAFMGDKDNTHVHLLISDCTAVTEFTKNELILRDFDSSSKPADVEVYMNQNLHLIEPVKAETSSFITFNGGSHLHRAILADEFEFRFMFRVLESDEVIGKPFKDSFVNSSGVFNDGVTDYSKIDVNYILNNVSKRYDSIVKYKDRIEVNYI